MHLKYFADSYEYVKRALINAIAEPPEWVVHPMLFRSIDGGRPGGGLDIAEYAAFLGLPEGAVLPGNARTRQQLVEDVAGHRSTHLFLDPDKGIVKGNGDTETVTVGQVRDIVGQRPDRITLVFDHAFRDGGDARQKVEEKRDLVCGEDHHGGAVVVREHRTVCFIWLSTDEGSAAAVMDRLQDHLHIPDQRIIAPQ